MKTKIRIKKINETTKEVEIQTEGNTYYCTFDLAFNFYWYSLSVAQELKTRIENLIINF